MLGQSVHRFFMPEDVAAGQVQTEMRSALERGRGLDERWHRRKHGERFWASGEMTALQDLGYTAIEAADDAAGLRVLQSNARIDLLVTDVGLPGGMNGCQVADAARVARPGLNVLFITGHAENAALSHGHLDPGMHVLTKPFAMEALASRIRELIAGGQAAGA